MPKSCAGGYYSFPLHVSVVIASPEAQSGYYNSSRFACKRGGNDVLHGARCALGRAMQLWVAIVPAPFSVEPGPMRILPANVAERMLTPSGLASALADRRMRRIEQLCSDPAIAAGRH